MSLRKCDICSKPGYLVAQYVHEVKRLNIEPYVFRYHLCKYHLASNNRWQSKLEVVQYIEDDVLLQEYAKTCV